MSNNLKRCLKAILLLSVLWAASQCASYAGFSDLFKDNDEAEAFKSKQNQNANADIDPNFTKVNPLKTDDDEDSTRLTPKRVRSAVHEIFHDEFSDGDAEKKIANARKTIDKGEKLMQACGNDHTKPEYKKGKVMKEIGEKQLADLKAEGSFQSSNSVLDPGQPSKAEKREKPDSL